MYDIQGIYSILLYIFRWGDRETVPLLTGKSQETGVSLGVIMYMYIRDDVLRLAI